MEITMVCPICGNEHSVVVEFEDWCAYEDGELAQKAFPYLSATEREQIISGFCPDCQKSIFGEECA